MQKNLKHIEKFVKFTYKKNKKKLINSVINVLKFLQQHKPESTIPNTMYVRNDYLKN